MEQSPSWEANRFSASQEIPRILWNSKVHYRSNKNTQLDATINRKIYCFVVETLLNMVRALLCLSSGARQTAIAASGFRMNVEVAINFTIDCCT